MGLGDVTNRISSDAVGRLLADHYRCSEQSANFTITGPLSSSPGYFRIGDEVIGYAQTSGGNRAKSPAGTLDDLSRFISAGDSIVNLPFDACQVVENLRQELYSSDSGEPSDALPANRLVRSLYYLLRPLLSVGLRRNFQKLYFERRGIPPFPAWPVDTSVENILEHLLVLSMKAQNLSRVPFIWFWPGGADSCTMMTHDVETSAGVDFCPALMDINDSFAIKSSFQVVPEKRYPVSPQYLENMRTRGFEVNVHDLNHDGHLFRTHAEFLQRAAQINQYGRQYGSEGFRAAILYRNVPWHDALDFSYDMSVPNVAHYDPQKGGCCTVFPFFAGKILELPLTTTQDYTLFNIFGDYSIRLWQKQIGLIQEKHGLISFIVHPDYIIEEKAQKVYRNLLAHLADLRRKGETWIALPGEVASWWRTRGNLRLVERHGTWQVEGEGCERARVAFAELSGDRLSYSMALNYSETARGVAQKM